MTKDAAPVKGLDQLISRIRAEAIEEADRKAADILSGAERRAAGIVEEARQHAREITVSAEKEIEKTRDASRKALQRACRDALIETRQAILNLFSSALQTEARSVLSGESLPELISSFISQLRLDPDGNSVSVQVGLSSASLLDALRKHLQQEAASGLHVEVTEDLSSGFRIEFKDDGFCYEVTPESVSQLLAGYLTPELQTLMKSEETA